MSTQLPTIRQLRYFVALAQTLSFSKAAEQCFVTQSTLSASIKDLEITLGQTLVERTSRHVIIAPSGQELLRRAESILKDLHDMVQSLNTFTEPLNGSMRIGVIPTIAPFIVPDLLSYINEEYPALELTFKEGLSAEILQDLDRGDVDICLMALPFDTASFRSKALFEDPFYLAVHKDKSKGRTSITVEQLKDYELILLEDGHCLKDHALDACQLIPADQSKILRASSLQTLLQMCAKGLGETLVPAMAIQNDWLMSANIKILPFRGASPKRTIGLVWRKASWNTQDFELIGDIITRINA